MHCLSRYPPSHTTAPPLYVHRTYFNAKSLTSSEIFCISSTATSDHSTFLTICYFFFNDTATTEIYTLSLHDALPIFLLKVTQTKRNFICNLACENSALARDRKSTRLNSSHVRISYAVFCLKKKKNHNSNAPYLLIEGLKCIAYHAIRPAILPLLHYMFIELILTLNL